MIYNGKKLWKYTKIIEVLNRFIALELWFTLVKLWYYGKNYGTMGKKHYGTIPKTTELWFTIEKIMVL